VAKIDVTKAEFSDLVEEVLWRLARDPAASHLWHWHPRPGCADEPAGRSRRNHLAALLGMLGATALGSGAAACDSKTGGGHLDGAAKDGRSADAPPCGDDPCAADSGPKPDGKTPKPDKGSPDAPPCGDDPCGCGDDPCACADDPCACADDPC
jgi:hypothetical protein